MQVTKMMRYGVAIGFVLGLCVPAPSDAAVLHETMSVSAIVMNSCTAGRIGSLDIVTVRCNGPVLYSIRRIIVQASLHFAAGRTMITY